MAGASKSIVINATPDKVFDVITAYDTYPQFMAECKEAKATRNGSEATVTYRVDVVIKTVRYTLKMKEERPNKVSWTFVEGEFMKDNKGSWVLEPEGEGSTKATYNIEITLGALVPKSIVNTLTEANLPKMLAAVKTRVESR